MDKKGLHKKVSTIFREASRPKETEPLKEIEPLKVVRQDPLKKIAALKKSFFKKKAVLGLDIGSGSIKAARLEESELGIRLTHFILKEFSPDETDRDEFIIKTIEEIIHAMGDNITRCISSVSGSDTNTSLITFPKMPHKEMISALKLRLKETLPFALDTAIFNFCTQKGSDDGRICTLTAASQKENINKQVSLIERNGLELSGITVVPCAWENLIKKAGLNVGESFLFIDIGRDITSILIFASGILRYCRELAVGGDQVTRSMIGPLISEEGKWDINFNEAERIKRRYGIPSGDEIERHEANLPSSQINAKIRPILERLIVEIKRSILLYRQDSKGKEIKRLLICGGGSKLKNIETFLAKALEIKVERFDPLKHIEIDSDISDNGRLREAGPQLGVALGLALENDKKINLLPPDLRLRPIASRINRISRIAISLVALTIFFLYIGMQKNISANRSILSSNEVYLMSLRSTVAKMNELKTLKNRLYKKISVINKFDRRKPLWDGILKEISNTIPENVFLDALSLEKVSGMVELNGKVFGSGRDNVLAKFMVALDESPFFRDVTLVPGNKTAGKKSMDFKINCRLIY